MIIYKLSHCLGNEEPHYEHFISTDHEDGEDWLNRFITDAQHHSNPDYSLIVETFKSVHKVTIRP